MKLKKFRIKNYKSIIDSGDCYLTDTVTILAGKNESGKTSILEALEDFDTEAEIRSEARPIKQEDAIPEISITFEVDKSSLKEIFKEIGLDKNFSKNVLLEIIKTFPKEYNISGKVKNDIGITDATKKTKIRKVIEKQLQTIKAIREKCPQIGGNVPDADFNSVLNLKSLTEEFRVQTNPNLANITDEEERGFFSSTLINLLDKIAELENLANVEANFVEEIKKRIPNFILFNSFEDIFPNKIPIAELEDNEWFKDLSIVSDLKIETIKSGEDWEKEKHKDDVNVTLKKDYERFWTQDLSNLSVNYDSDFFYFWIKEEGYPYKPSLRSKGRQWHLAFYIKVTARAHEDMPNIILIDEPGLFLHATAQKDILDKLEVSAKKTQLIFSTHSPYLLEAHKFNRIRLVHRTNENGTKIVNKIHALADKETLTPILTAIGLELNSGIAHLDKIKNVVVEGPSDLYYLEAFKRLKNKNDINFVFGGGAGNMPLVGTILHGWGCKVLYLYDKDKGKKDGEKNLKNNWLVSKEFVLSVIDSAGTIEDIFDKDDFKKYILKDGSKTYSQSNSEYIKKNNIDKVVSAKLFLELIESEEEIDLQQATIDNISKLFKNLDKKF